MAMGINLYTANLNQSVIDRAVVQEVTENIFARANTKNTNIDAKYDLSKFNRPELGIDLYSNKINAQKAIEISMRNSGLDIQLNQNFVANIQYLNTQAALNNVQKFQQNLDGKMPIAPTTAEKNEVKANFSMPRTLQLIATAQTNKDKRGSNPFSMSAPANSKDKDVNSENTSELNIFA